MFYVLEIQHYLYIGAAGIVVAVSLILLIIRRKPRFTHNLDVSKYIEALGGLANINEIKATGSRLTVGFVRKEKINEQLLKELGVVSIVMMTKKAVLLMKATASKLAEEINKIKL